VKGDFSLKSTKFVKEIKRKNCKYEIAKLKSLIKWKLSFGKNRKKREFSHSIFNDNHYWEREDPNALPNNYYFKPTDILLYDLIPKQNLKETKKGLIQLFKKCLTHKYMSAYGSEEDVEKLISGLDQTLHSGNSWYNVGLFDFAYDTELDSFIEHFDIHVRNFSSSYAVIEMKVALSDSLCNEISDFIQTQYKKPGMCVHEIWTQDSKRKSGAKIGYGVSGGTTDEYAKSQIIYEQMEFVKKLFLREIKKYFPLMVYGREKNILGINIFETNIKPDLGLEPSIYGALGLDEMYGFNLSIAERLYMSTATIRGRDSFPTDMMYIYNPSWMESHDGYGTIHNKMVYEFIRGHMDYIYKMIVLKNLGLQFLNLVTEYRNKVNAITSKKSSQKRLLKLKYELSKDFYDFNKITEELPFDKTIERAKRILEKNEYATSSVYYGRHPYELFTDNPKWMWSQVKNNYTEIESDLQRKIDISSELTAFSREKSNRNITVTQLLISTVTFVLLIFPEKASIIADWIKTLWTHICQLFAR
jgi:hypothetical protein